MKDFLSKYTFMGSFTLFVLGLTCLAAVMQITQARAVGNHSLYLPVALRQHAALSDPSLFGVQMYGDTRPQSAYYNVLMESQATWVRAQLNWENVEPVDVSPEEYNFLSSDALTSAARADAGNVRFIATIHHAPDWAAASPRGPLYVSALPDFAEFVGAIVERYDGDGLADAPGSPVVNYWEFYNEPDANSDYFEPGWGEFGGHYAQMLSVVYPAVKSANPNAQVVMGGIAYDWFEDQDGPFVRSFLDDVLAAGGGAHFDVMNFHSYPAFSHTWAQQGPGLLEKTQAVRSKLAEYGVGHKPIVITEAGWHSDSPPQQPSSPQIQARYVVQLFTQSLAADVDVMIWWMLHDPGGFYYANGLVTGEGSAQPKLSFWAYQTAVAELTTAEFQYRLTPAQTGATDMEVYKFNDSFYNRRVYVAWLNPVDTTTIKSLTLPGTHAVVRDIIYGNTQTIVDDNGDGHVTVQVGAQPIYVEFNQ